MNPLLETIHVLDLGEVTLIDYMGDDLSIVNAARVSLDQESESLTERDEGLVRYLTENEHGTPFEQNAMKFRVKLPIFVAREWQRHRIGWSYNEQSSRYMELAGEFYMPAPSDIRTQTGKPGHYTYKPVNEGTARATMHLLQESYFEAWTSYKLLLKSGVAKEQARVILPLATYTTMIATCNARSLMHFLHLRMAPTAQYEIRVYAQALYDIFAALFPVACSNFFANNFIAP